MPKINISVDTGNGKLNSEKKLKVTSNGKEIPGVQYISISCYYDDDGNVSSVDVSLEKTERDDNGMSKNVRYYAYGSEACDRLRGVEDKVEDVDGFIGVDKCKDDIIKAFFNK